MLHAMKRAKSTPRPAAKKATANRVTKKAPAKKATARRSAKKALAKKAPAKSAATQRPATERVPSKRVPSKKAPAKKAPAKKQAARRFAQRADLGAPVDGFFLKQPSPQREILEELRRLVDEVVPHAVSAIKWGNPFYTLDGTTICALGAHKSHVNLILAGPPGTFEDPHGLLIGEGKTGRHLKLTSLAELPRDEVLGWLRTAAQLAVQKAGTKS
jgi:hypothetical protein